VPPGRLFAAFPGGQKKIMNSGVVCFFFSPSAVNLLRGSSLLCVLKGFGIEGSETCSLSLYTLNVRNLGNAGCKCNS